MKSWSEPNKINFFFIKSKFFFIKLWSSKPELNKIFFFDKTLAPNPLSVLEDNHNGIHRTAIDVQRLQKPRIVFRDYRTQESLRYLQNPGQLLRNRRIQNPRIQNPKNSVYRTEVQ